jgi:hypothetical protein
MSLIFTLRVSRAQRAAALTIIRKPGCGLARDLRQAYWTICDLGEGGARMKKFKSVPILGAAAFGIAALLAVTPAEADTFQLTSCHISTGCPAAGTSFGTVTLTQVGTSVNFSVSLANASRFVETGAGAGELFLFNDSIAGSTITTIASAPNTPAGGLSGFTNLSPQMADGTGSWTASVECTTASDCNGGSAPTMNSLTFTVTNATLAQLETPTALTGTNIFVADILCGPTVTGCAGQTGPVDVSVPAPLIGHGLLVLLAIGGVLFGSRLVETLKNRRLHAA